MFSLMNENNIDKGFKIPSVSNPLSMAAHSSYCAGKVLHILPVDSYFTSLDR